MELIFPTLKMDVKALSQYTSRGTICWTFSLLLVMNMLQVQAAAVAGRLGGSTFVGELQSLLSQNASCIYPPQDFFQLDSWRIDVNRHCEGETPIQSEGDKLLCQIFTFACHSLCSLPSAKDYPLQMSSLLKSVLQELSSLDSFCAAFTSTVATQPRERNEFVSLKTILDNIGCKKLCKADTRNGVSNPGTIESEYKINVLCILSLKAFQVMQVESEAGVKTGGVEISSLRTAPTVPESQDSMVPGEVIAKAVPHESTNATSARKIVGNATAPESLSHLVSALTLNLAKRNHTEVSTDKVGSNNTTKTTENPGVPSQSNSVTPKTHPGTTAGSVLSVPGQGEVSSVDEGQDFAKDGINRVTLNSLKTTSEHKVSASAPPYAKESHIFDPALVQEQVKGLSSSPQSSSTVHIELTVQNLVKADDQATVLDDRLFSKANMHETSQQTNLDVQESSDATNVRKPETSFFVSTKDPNPSMPEGTSTSALNGSRLDSRNFTPTSGEPALSENAPPILEKSFTEPSIPLASSVPSALPSSTKSSADILKLPSSAEDTLPADKHPGSPIGSGGDDYEDNEGEGAPGGNPDGSADTGASNKVFEANGLPVEIQAPRVPIPGDSSSQNTLKHPPKLFEEPEKPFSHDDEDGGFFSYFLTFFIVCGIGWLVFHNKKRIIAVVVEGRRPRSARRRSSGSYRKLENNFD